MDTNKKPAKRLESLTKGQILSWIIEAFFCLLIIANLSCLAALNSAEAFAAKSVNSAYLELAVVQDCPKAFEYDGLLIKLAAHHLNQAIDALRKERNWIPILAYAELESIVDEAKATSVLTKHLRIKYQECW